MSSKPATRKYADAGDEAAREYAKTLFERAKERVEEVAKLAERAPVVHPPGWTELTVTRKPGGGFHISLR